METLYTQNKCNPVRCFLQWLLSDSEIRIMTVKIEYFREGQDWKNPIVYTFGHKGALDEI